uniref:hypothetical protein n=1 Tax=Flavobacterium sp. TaxID=239 RepID=UPI00404A4D1E
MKYLIYALVFFIHLNINAQKNNETIEICGIIEETFEKSPIIGFLNTTTKDRKTIDLFLNDNNSLSFLYVNTNDISYGVLKNNEWFMLQNEIEVRIKDDILTKELYNYADLNTIYSLNCPQNMLITDTSDDFEIIWIKKNGTITFIYYVLKCGIFCLDKEDQNKIDTLIKSIKPKIISK